MNCVFLEGVPIRYGQPEPWKAIAQQIGRTKPSRAPKPETRKRKANDGRPPDTSRELLGSKRQKIELTPAFKTKPISLRPSYPWANNSCWLDTALELLFQTVMRDFRDFSVRFEDMHMETSLHILFRVLEMRKLVDEDDEGAADKLSQQRDNFRKHLQNKKLVKSATSFESVFVSSFNSLYAS
jgi:hypothetical protein